MTFSELREKPLGDVDRAAFFCGVPPLDEYFTGERLVQDVEAGVTAAYVIFDAAENLVGYYTLSNHTVVRDELSGALARKMKYSSVPATLIGRLAIQKPLQRGGIGTVLLVRALKKAHDLGQESGSRVVVVDTISDEARTFYRKRGFQDLNNDRNQLFFDLRRVAEMAQRAGLSV